MSDFKTLRPLAQSYVVGVVLIGGAAVVHSLHQLLVEPVGPQWLVLAALTLLTGSFTVKVPATTAHLSVSEAFVFASVLLFGPPAGTVIVVIECLIIMFSMRLLEGSIHKLLFNTASLAVSVWVAGSMFFLVWGIEPYSKHATELKDLLLPLLSFALVYFLLNTGLVALAVGFETGKRPLEIWKKNFAWLFFNYVSAASVAALVVTYSRDVDYSKDIDLSVLLLVFPLLVVSYLTLRVTTQRLNDSHSHISALNRLYLSTIETLAMAIDAKDQITHGHIRRVQSYAVALAKKIGVTDDGLIKAIEAAALLHDMGKLAVPEYILNKPGKLTAAEFEKMKLHAPIGADILSAIDFPYPVVPIVRHHHENWDGTGYPDGLRGAEIPIGARILSVVDCYDALTSDRPYRPALSDADALQILTERRGNMYDPMVVDTFVRVYETIKPEPPTANLSGETVQEIRNARKPIASGNESSRRDETGSSADEILALYELARALAGQSNITDTGDIIVKHLRRLIPFAQSALFLYETNVDELVVRHAVGEVSNAIVGMRVSLGQKLSGWVAANRQAVFNSDPALDLEQIARSVQPPLGSCLSAPLICGSELVGVLTLYAVGRDAFTEEHKRVMNVVATQIAHTFKCTAAFETHSNRDPVTGLPSLRQLQRLMEMSRDEPAPPTNRITLLVMDVVHLNDINQLHDRTVGDEVLRHVAQITRARLRVGDILFRYGNDEFIALLHDTDLETANAIGDRIREEIRRSPVVSRSAEAVLAEVNVTALNIVPNEKSFSEHIAMARQLVHQHATIH